MSFDVPQAMREQEQRLTHIEDLARMISVVIARAQSAQPYSVAVISDLYLLFIIVVRVHAWPL